MFDRTYFPSGYFARRYWVEHSPEPVSVTGQPRIFTLYASVGLMSSVAPRQYAIGVGGNMPPTSAYDAAATAYFNAVATAGGSLTTSDKAIYNTLFAGLRTDGLLSVLDRLSVAAPTATPTLVDLIGLNTQTATATFAASQGYTGNQTTTFVNTGFNPGDGGTYNFLRNSASFGCYIRTSRTTGQNFVSMGNNTAGNSGSLFYPWYTDNSAYIDVNDATGTSNAITHPANVQGMYVASRTASNLITLYRNGSSIGTGSLASAAVVNLVFYICGYNGNGTLLAPSADQHAAWFFGAALDATQSANLTTRINNFFTSYGTNVF